MAKCESKCPGPLIHTEEQVIYRGGCHHVVCPGDGKHYWFWNDGTGVVRETGACDVWVGGCPTKRSPFKPSTLADYAAHYLKDRKE
jgi:hypothetical protein